MKLSSIVSLVSTLLFVAPTQAQDRNYPQEYIGVSVDEATKTKSLLIPIAVYKNAAGQELDLVGVVHVAAADYYEELNHRFQSYDRVFFEMVDGGDLVERELLMKKMMDDTATEEDKKRYEEIVKGSSSGMNPLSIVLQIVTAYLIGETELQMQQTGIDYGYKHFIFADMTQNELKAAMKERGETVLGLALCELLLGKKKDPEKVKKQQELAARMMNPEGEKVSAVREFLIDGLVDAMESNRMNDTAIIISRNEKAMEILDEAMKGQDYKRVALFYGAAHIPDFHERLVARGYTLQSTEWLEAFSTDGDSDSEKITMEELTERLKS